MTVPSVGDTNAALYQAMSGPLNAIQAINQTINDQLGAVMGQLAQLGAYGTKSQAMGDPLNAIQAINQTINDQLGAVMGRLAQLGAYGTNSQAMGDPLGAVMEHLAQLGVEEETLGQVQQAIEQVVQNGADPKQVGNELANVLQSAAEQGVEDPNQILQALGQTLQQIDMATADSKFQMVFEQLSNLGADNNTLQQLQQAVGQVIENGIDPNQLADVMIQVLQSADQEGITDPGQILPALGQVLQQAAQASGQGAQQDPQASGQGVQQDPQASGQGVQQAD